MTKFTPYMRQKLTVATKVDKIYSMPDTDIFIKVDKIYSMPDTDIFIKVDKIYFTLDQKADISAL